jgi:hypothetical protein
MKTFGDKSNWIFKQANDIGLPGQDVRKGELALQ